MLTDYVPPANGSHDLVKVPCNTVKILTFICKKIVKKG